ncbi:Putative multidrug resistance protein MdtD [Paenibacillus solanacearum]|uniref:Multidrug resistance protein MdtD n=1 Tax=Paenibacillus solanacearum TaxID=2048548 RepID=A0A916NJU7_9BACL|nr:MFS transporter [Paenibacillus solanacearum]CAG7632989.1 Putative multidrug resistance protein MdtD [Paenibacillus solanacearum]
MSTMVKSAALPDPAASEDAGRKPRLMLAVMLLSVFMSVANIFIVNVATPSIQRGLHAAFSDVQFVITSYTLAFAVSLIIGGRLGDRFGRKRMLLLGVIGFTVSSMLCGLASGVAMLIAARIMQGLSAALISPQVLSLIQVNYSPSQRGAVFGLYGAAQGIAASTGQVIGGLLLQLNPWGLDWRTVFFFNVPVGLALLFLIPSIRESRTDDGAKLDWAGALLVAAGLLMLVYPLVQGQKEGWPPGIIASLILSVPLLAAFVWHEKRLLRRGLVPFMNVELFGQRMFTIGMTIVFMLMCSQAAFFLVTAYFLQSGLGMTALAAGFVILPMGLGYFAASLLSARAASRLGSHVLTLGTALTVTGFLALALSVHATGISPGGYVWVPALAVLGLGQGFIAAPLTNIVLAKIRSSHIGSASGILTTGMQVAFAIGTGLIGIVWLNATGQHADSVGKQVALQLQQRSPAYATLSAEQSGAALEAVRACYPLLAQSSGASPVPADCRAAAADASPASHLYADGIRQATAQNYADSYLLCLFILAALAAVMFPPVLALGRKRQPAAAVPVS